MQVGGIIPVSLSFLARNLALACCLSSLSSIVCRCSGTCSLSSSSDIFNSSLLDVMRVLYISSTYLINKVHETILVVLRNFQSFLKLKI